MTLSKINEALTPEEIAERRRKAAESHMRMYLSKRLTDVFKEMDSPIAKELVTLSRKNIKFDISFMDLPMNGKKEDIGKVTVFQTAKVKKLEDAGMDIKNARNNYTSDLWKSNQREQPARIGKVVRKLFKDQFTGPQYEQFGNEFKAKQEQDDSKFKVVYGDDILYWYHEERYAKMRASLGGSCMRQGSKNHYMNFYAKNGPKNGAHSHVGLLILLDDNKKLLARAIVWFNSVKPYLKNPRTFMDRIYYSEEQQQDIFKDFAKKNNWLYKKKQTYEDKTWIDPEDNSEHNLTISFRLKPGEFEYYPYLDTLHYYTPETGRISSQQPKKSAYNKYKILSLRSPGGSFDRVN